MHKLKVDTAELFWLLCGIKRGMEGRIDTYFSINLLGNINVNYMRIGTW